MVASSRRRPIQTLPASSAQRAWKRATSGETAGIYRIGSCFPLKGFWETFQSGRNFRRSEPSTPRRGMKGTPFSVAWSAVWTAGQVASRTTISPFSAASVKRGARPASPSVTALVSISATQPAPMRRSAQGHEGHAFLGRLERGVDRRAGGVAHHDLAFLGRLGEARREARLAERHRAGLDLGDAARADEEIRAQPELRHAEKPEPFRLAPDQGAHDLHRDERIVGRQAY